MDTDTLEKAINSAKESGGVEKSEVPEMSKSPRDDSVEPEEEIGFHKGVLNTLMAERNELVKMVGNVEAIMQAHVKRLKELGVELK